VPSIKICTAKAISAAILKVYPADLSVSYAGRAGGFRQPSKKEQKITSEARLLRLKQSYYLSRSTMHAAC
jgi:hypothetical protein